MRMRTNTIFSHFAKIAKTTNLNGYDVMQKANTKLQTKFYKKTVKTNETKKIIQ